MRGKAERFWAIAEAIVEESLGCGSKYYVLVAFLAPIIVDEWACTSSGAPPCQVTCDNPSNRQPRFCALELPRISRSSDSMRRTLNGLPPDRHCQGLLFGRSLASRSLICSAG
jgi:hypothetical protein